MFKVVNPPALASTSVCERLLLSGVVSCQLMSVSWLSTWTLSLQHLCVSFA